MSSFHRSIVPCLIFSLALAVSGCGENVGPAETQEVTEDDAADIIAGAIAGKQSTSGLTAQLEELSIVASGGTLPKLQGPEDVQSPTFDTTIVRQRTGLFSYNYRFYYSYEFISQNTMQFRYAMRGTFDTPRVASDDSANAVLDIAGILSGPSLVVNGTYVRLGSQTLKLRTQNAFRSDIGATLSVVNVNKTTRMVESGTMTVQVRIEHSSGVVFGFSAVVTFTGNQRASIVINNKRYTANLDTGTADPA